MLSPSVLKLFRTPLFLVSVTALICLLFTAGLLRQQHQERLEIRTTQYGQALANLAAKQATEATINHDLVSLQVILSDIARNPDILNATVHDVDNRLLVQAGSSPDAADWEERDHQPFTASITLQDSIAGYVTVNIDTQALYEQFDDTWLMAMLGLAGAMVALSIINHRQQFYREVAEQNAAADHSDEPPAARPPAEDDICVTLHLRCRNWPALRQQLSATLRQQLFDELQRHLGGINALYAGRIVLADSDLLELEFRGDEIGNTTFRAICAAQLLFLLLEQSSAGIRLHYAGAVYATSKGTALNLYLQQSQHRRQLSQTLTQHAGDEKLLLDSQHCATSQLLQRLETSEGLVEDQWLLISSLRPSYQGLLDKQARQLQSLLTV